MRILLAASASYDPPKGGSTRSNLVWLRALAARGHEVRVLCGGAADQQHRVDGIAVEAWQGMDRLAARVAPAVLEFQPDFVLVSSEDLSHALLRQVHFAAPDRFVYLAHTPQWFPFGPEAWHADAGAARMLKDALAIVAIGEHMGAYIERHLGRAAEVIPPALYGEPPWAEFDNFAAGTALLINPSAVKGIKIFLGVADALPQYRFLALRGWGTTAADEAALRSRANVEVLETVPRIEDVLKGSSVLLAPSLWYEGFGLVATEALLRGVPVIASDHGGLTEAALMRLPVRPIRRWLSSYDDTGMPQAVVEEQPLEEWIAAVDRLLSDREEYERERARGLEHAREFVSGLDAGALEELLERLKPRRLRIFLIHNSTYFPGSGGGDKSNRLLMEALAARGHRMGVFTRLEKFGEQAHGRQGEELRRRGIGVEEWPPLGLRYQLGVVRVHTVTRESNLRRALAEDLVDFDPDVIVCSTDDPAHLLYETALAHEGGRVVYLARATIALPFGPDASSVSEERTARFRQADAVVGVSEYVARYCREEGGFAEAVHVPISLADCENPPYVGSFGNAFVTLVNPSAVKGLPILLGLADRMPEVRFAAVPGWGTTGEDIEAMKRRGNITLLEPVEDITEILRRTRVTLVPSLWAEARSRMVVESLSRGVPVLAAAVGGIEEAMCGVEHVLPVNPIVRYRSGVSEQMAPEAETPAQDLAPWEAALRPLVEDRGKWEDLSRRSREAAMRYLGQLTAEPFEEVLRRALRQPRQRSVTQAASLSPVKRKLLALRLERHRGKQPVFPLRWGRGMRVLLLPWAEASAQSWGFLNGRREMELLPGQLPPPGETFAAWIGPVTDAVGGEMDGRPYVLAGHSMGGGLAFEVARELQRRGLPLPARLVLSSCHAPATRKRGPASEGRQRALFREHVYEPGAPLDCPIVAAAGAEETLDIDGWGRETRAGFRAMRFPGGHFWLKDAPEEFLNLLELDF
ncbi:MAG: glycosyltransferase [Acidobacteriota bacterium]